MIIWPLVGVSVGAVLLILGSVFGWKVFPDIVDDRIEEKVAIIEGTDQYERWEVTPQALDFKVYFFNVTNPVEILAGEKPIVKELGPYIWRQYRSKHNITFNAGKTRAAYTMTQRYEFDAAASSPLTENDDIMMLSMHMNSVLQVAEDILPGFIALLNGFLNEVFGPGSTESIFIRTTPKKFLFEGITFCDQSGTGSTVICPLVASRGTKSVRTEPDGSLKFSLFNHKNVTNDGEYIINTGTGPDQIKRNQFIEEWNRTSTLSFWKPNLEKPMFPSPCNMINGTDASGYPPFRKKDNPMYIYSSDICRSVQIHYHDTMKYRGIPGYRYITRDDFLNELDVQYGQDCFCVNQVKGIVQENGCLYRGAMDLSTCQMAPVVLTAPHMWGAHEIYRDKIIGQTPDVDKHRIFIDIEPNTGAPLQGGKRVQFNMFLRPIHPTITMLNNVTTALLPILWVDEGIELNDDNVDTIKDELINVLKILTAVHWTLFSVGLATMLGCSVWYYIRFRQLQKQK